MQVVIASSVVLEVAVLFGYQQIRFDKVFFKIHIPTTQRRTTVGRSNAQTRNNLRVLAYNCTAEMF